MLPNEIAQLQLLKAIEQKPRLSQRELGVSLGKWRCSVRGLIDKGLDKAGNFRRNDNKLGYLYLLTPAGICEKFRLIGAYLVRKEIEYVNLHEEIALLRSQMGPAKIFPCDEELAGGADCGNPKVSASPCA